jgi:hypothetical protein
LSFFAVVAALTLAGVVLLPRLLPFTGSPQTDVLVALKRLEQEGIRTSIPGSPEPLTSQRFRLDRLTVELSPDGRRAQAVFTLDFTGTLGATSVSALGLERVRLEQTKEGWRPEGGVWTPMLAAVTKQLVRRVNALERADRQALAELLTPDALGALEAPGLSSLLAMPERQYQARAWYVRSERDQVLVTEEYHVVGALPDRPVDEVGQRRLILVPGEKELRFRDSLM